MFAAPAQPLGGRHVQDSPPLRGGTRRSVFVCVPGTLQGQCGPGLMCSHWTTADRGDGPLIYSILLCPILFNDYIIITISQPYVCFKIKLPGFFELL